VGNRLPEGLKRLQPGPGRDGSARITRICAPRQLITQAPPAARIGGAERGGQPRVVATPG